MTKRSTGTTVISILSMLGSLLTLAMGILVLVAMAFLPGQNAAQNPSTAFWELRPEQMNAMLLQVPDGDQLRYQRLRQYFSELHCTPNSMEEQTVDKRQHKNLLCVLPGKDSQQIVVAARYERRWERADQGWSDAVMLPILYNALLAEPRQHTFVFVGLHGAAGEKQFIGGIRKRYLPAVKAMVILDSLGFGEPRYLQRRDAFFSADPRPTVLLASEAAFTAKLQSIPAPVNSPRSPLAFANTMLFRAETIPSILFYSDLKPAVSIPAFHQEFDFVAYYLCRIDARLAIPLPAAKQ